MSRSARTTAAVGVAIAMIILLWVEFQAGYWALLVVPLLTIYVVNVHLGGGLNDSPLDGITRLRRRSAAGSRNPSQAPEEQ